MSDEDGLQVGDLLSSENSMQEEISENVVRNIDIAQTRHNRYYDMKREVTEIAVEVRE